MRPGAVHPRPPRNKSQAHTGVHPLSPITHTQQFQQLPQPIGEPPYHYNLEDVIPGVGKTIAANNQLVFHVVGDTGGVKTPDYQREVATAMKTDLNLPVVDRPAFFYHLGDVVYYNGQITDYYSQFYEPYDHYSAPIFSIPGNHDGDPIDSSQTSLDGWVAYFMQDTPHVDPTSHDAPRVTLSQPNPVFHAGMPVRDDCRLLQQRPGAWFSRFGAAAVAHPRTGDCPGG